MVAGAVNDAPAPGEVTDTAGAWLVAELTVTETAADVRVAPPLSRATAVS